MSILYTLNTFVSSKICKKIILNFEYCKPLTFPVISHLSCNGGFYFKLWFYRGNELLNYTATAAVIHISWLSCRVLESKWSAQRGTVTQVCGPEYQGRHACFNNQEQESLATSEWIITRLIFLLPSLYFKCCMTHVWFLVPLHLSPISPVCRATSNNKVKEMVMLELSYVNSNLQLLMGQLEGLNSSVEVYQNTQ